MNNNLLKNSKLFRVAMDWASALSSDEKGKIICPKKYHRYLGLILSFLEVYESDLRSAFKDKEKKPDPNQAKKVKPSRVVEKKPVEQIKIPIRPVEANPLE